MSDPVKDLIEFIDEAQFHHSGDDVVFNWPELRKRVDALRTEASGEFRAKGAFFTVGGEWYRKSDVVKIKSYENGVQILLAHDGFTQTLFTTTSLVGVLQGLS